MRSVLSGASVSTIFLIIVACRQPPPKNWGPVDLLGNPPASVDYAFGGRPVSPEDYQQFLEWGETFFRDGGFGNERSVTDVLGVLQGTIDIPCGTPEPGCTESSPVFDAVLAAVDDLDGVEGNLFIGNGGGFTSDLTLVFPPGSSLYGLPVPERVHTGLEIDAGSVFPIGVVPVPAPPGDESLPWLIRPEETGMEGAPDGAFRVRLSCAACHYSLDIDQDGSPDLRTTRAGELTEGSPWGPHHGWGVGNQDLDFGWLVALSANPLMAGLIIGGDVHDDSDLAPKRFARWLIDNLDDEELVHRRVIQSVLVQPRGWADTSSDARFNTIQIPALYSQGAWPANSNGAIFNGADRNSTVWTGALDFTGLIGLCKERSQGLPWEPPGAFHALKCYEFADLMLRYSPAGRAGFADDYRRDILGISDGVPGMLDPDSVVVLKLVRAMPKQIYNHPDNRLRQRRPRDYGEQGKLRRTALGLLGYRIAVPPDFRAENDTDAIAARVGSHPDEFVSDCVSLFLDWMEPPPNPSPWLTDPLLRRGQRVFEESGCAECHGGPFLTDNRIHWLGDDGPQQYGSPRAPSTAGWRVLYRGMGPPIGTEPQRTTTSRTVRRLASAEYDPATGLAVSKADPINGLLSVREVGYKTPALRGLWASQPYLHDGGVAVSLAPGAQAVDSLSAHLSRGEGLWLGNGAYLLNNRVNAEEPVFADAALSLQALVLRDVREEVIAANTRPLLPIVGGGGRKSMNSLGIAGIGHEFWVDDVPGGPDVTALVAYLLAIDNCPGDVACVPRDFGYSP